MRNWLSLGHQVEVILYGNAQGTNEACRRLNIQHVPDIATTESGIPYFGAIAGHAADHARFDIQVYLNCDILLTPHILTVIERISFVHFLMVGQRIDMSEGVVVDVADLDLLTQLHALARNGRIVLHPPAGSDYFAFRRGMWKGLSPVIIGRGGYDNALIAWCLLKGIPVVDATLAVTALHQFHDYGHVAGGVGGVFRGPEAEENLRICGRFGGIIPTLDDATWMLREARLSPSFARGDWMRGLVDRHLRWVPGRIGRRAVVRAWSLASKLGLTRQLPVGLFDLPVFKTKEA